MRIPPWTTVLVGLLAAAMCLHCGCDCDKKPKAIEEYGLLPGLKGTHHEGLKDELARLQVERATPEQLASRPAAGAGGRGQITTGQVHAGENAAVALAEIFHEDMVRLINRRIDKIYPTGRFQFDPIALEKAIQLRTDHDEPRRRVRVALSRPHCDFRFQHTRGLYADTSFVDVAWVSNRLEALLTAELLAAGKPDQAVESLEFALRMIAFLAKEKNLIARRAAAELRAEAISVMEAIAQHPQTTRTTLEDLHEKMAAQLSSWPSDADAWIGERAMGLHTYEMIRDGHLLNILSPEEIEQFGKDGSLGALLSATDKRIDEDELFYLSALRTVVGSCDRPYYERKDVLRDIRKKLHQLRDTLQFPLVAAHILLEDFEEGHKMQARDRAVCEAWTLALASATGRQPPRLQTNPYTGQPYRVVRDKTRVVVWGVGQGVADQPAIVPLPLDGQ